MRQGPAQACLSLTGRIGRFVLAPIIVAAVLLTGSLSHGMMPGHYQVVLIPILGVSVGAERAGTVAYVELGFTEREDQRGLLVEFSGKPGQFSPLARAAVTRGIYHTAKALGLRTDSWTVALKVPHEDLTIYGESLSAMVGVSVAALAQGEALSSDLVITGTVTPDGHIGPVGGVPQKVRAAQDAHIRRVVVPEEQDPADPDWHTPFLMQVSPLGSVKEAYDALTETAAIATASSASSRP